MKNFETIMAEVVENLQRYSTTELFIPYYKEFDGLRIVISSTEDEKKYETQVF